MPLITLVDFTNRHEEDLSAHEQARVSVLIDDASALVVAAVNDPTVTDPWDGAAPAAVVPVVYRMVRRALVNPDGYESETIGSYTWRHGREPGIFMTKTERREVRRAAGGTPTTVTLEAPYAGTETYWLETAP